MTTNIDPGWEIRQARSTDVDSLVMMRLRLQEHLERANRLLLQMSTRGRDALPDQYRQWIIDGSSCVLVAEIRATEGLVGMAMGRAAVLENLVPSHVGRIDDVWVEPPFRRQGVCRALLKQLLVFFEQKGVQTLDLYYAIGNAEAECAWLDLGFRPVLTVASARVGAIIKQLEHRAD